MAVKPISIIVNDYIIMCIKTRYLCLNKQNDINWIKSFKSPKYKLVYSTYAMLTYRCCLYLHSTYTRFLSIDSFHCNYVFTFSYPSIDGSLLQDQRVARKNGNVRVFSELSRTRGEFLCSLVVLSPHTTTSIYTSGIDWPRG